MQVAYLLYEHFTALDIIGPYEVLNSVPGTDSIFVAETAGPVHNDAGTITMIAQRSLDEVRAPDIVVVPGGMGTRLLLQHEPLLSWLRTVHETTTWTTSVCTGSLLLAAAGLLNDQPASTHWLARDTLASLGARPSTERVLRHGRVVTAAGVSAGIDMALCLVALMHGDEAAQAIQLAIEYDPQPPFDAGAPEKASPATVVAVQAAFRVREAELIATAEPGAAR